MASGNPSKKKSTAKASGRTWQKQKGIELKMPSENVALVRRPGPDVLMRKGVLPDAFRTIVEKAIKTGKGMKQDSMNEVLGTEGGIEMMLDAMDRVLIAVVIEPQVLYHKGIKDDEGNWIITTEGKNLEIIPEEARDEEAIYADDVEFEDKEFIFNFVVGGTRDVATFRRESKHAMESLSHGESAEHEAVDAS